MEIMTSEEVLNHIKATIRVVKWRVCSEDYIEAAFILGQLDHFLATEIENLTDEEEEE